MKAGWKTTEFWVTILTQLVGFGVLSGVIPVEVQSDAGDTVVNGGAFITSILAVWRYIKGRSDVKVEASAG